MVSGRGAALWLAGLAVAAIALGSCGGDGDDDGETFVPLPTASASASPVPSTPQSTPEPTELRVAFINLMSPVGTDATNTVPADTFDRRLDLVIAELKEFKPDIVGFNEATVTEAHGDAREKLATALKMEPFWLRANPWFPTQTRDANDAIAKQIGFEEGELILVRSDRFPLIGGIDPHWINPRTSETEGRVAFRLKVKIPGPAGEADIYITHLTGGGEAARTRQAASVAGFIRSSRGPGPAIVMGDLGDVPESGAYAAMMEIGLNDPFAEAGVATCCRESLVGEQKPMTLRTDYLFAAGWWPAEMGAIGEGAAKQADETVLFASDHIGLFAVFALP
jgi:endonuclease/exonuclease/phosphatase family metal-dependent hydrolase